jgi:hypothetical protein
MKIMIKHRLTTIDEVQGFLKNNNEDFYLKTRKERYDFVREILTRFRYHKIIKKEKGIIKSYLLKITGYSEQQIKRLIKEWKKNGLIFVKRKRGKAFKKKYNVKDIDLLIKTDIAHRTPNTPAVCEILRREYEKFGKEAYVTIAQISASHIYNIRNTTNQYLSSNAIRYSKTNPVQVKIGERRKPRPEGKPGFVRIDSVHQGDFKGIKGVYHINIIDEITQYEYIACVEKISEYYLIPVLEEMQKAKLIMLKKLRK